MNLTDHCQLCDHQIVHYGEGTKCGITDRKPLFNKTCINIALNEKFEQKLTKANVEFENVKRKRTIVYIYCALFLIFGLFVIYGGFYLGNHILDRGVISAVPLIIMAAGCAVMGTAIGPFNGYRNNLALAKSKKDSIDDVLMVYNIDYDITIKFGKEIHGSQDYNSDLKVRGRK